MNTVVALSIVLGGTAERFYAPSGAVEITRERGVIVAGIRDAAALEALVGREPGGCACRRAP